MKISNREIIIAAIAILVLLGIGYVINNNSSSKSDDQKQEDQVDLNGKVDENTDEQKGEDTKEVEGVASTAPETNAEIVLASAPTSVVIKLDKEITAGSAIEVMSDKNVDVVTGGNKITTDLKQISAPVNLEVSGVYTVTYKINWQAGGSSDGSYKFTIK